MSHVITLCEMDIDTGNLNESLSSVLHVALPFCRIRFFCPSNINILRLVGETTDEPKSGVLIRAEDLTE